MRTVVVGYDGSTASTAAVGWAAGEARLHGAELEVWTAVDPFPPVTAGELVDEATALEQMRSAVADLTRDTPATFHVGSGRAVPVLGAAGVDADLLVVGSRGRNPVTRLLLGSVSAGCLHRAPCAVAVVRPGTQTRAEHGRVLVGIDSSQAARHALKVAAQEALVRGATLQVLHGVHWDHLAVELTVPTTRQLMAWGQDLVRGELARSGVEATTTVLNGHPPDLLVRHSTEADLLVLGSRGHGLVANAVTGSTTDYCVRHAACPVLVVRPLRTDGA